MLQIYPKLITDALSTVRYPGSGKNLIEAEMLEDDLRIDGMNVSFSLIFEKSTDPFLKSVVKAAEAAIHTYVDKGVNVTINIKTLQAARPEPGKMLPQVKNVIAVSSGKGGVGLSRRAISEPTTPSWSLFRRCCITAVSTSTEPKMMAMAELLSQTATTAPHTAPMVVAISRNIPKRMLVIPSFTYALPEPLEVAMEATKAAPTA